MLLIAAVATTSALLLPAALAQTDTATPTSTATATPTDNSTASLNGFGPMMGNMGFGPRSHGCLGFGSIAVSSEYNQTINSILTNDSDIANLTSQGYTVTAIHPIIQSTIGADGTVTTKASTAIVTMQNGTAGFATIKVDVTNAQVTEITILTRTVIDKSTT